MSTWKYSVNVTTLSGSHQHVYINIYLFIISCLNESQFLVLDPKNIKEKKDRNKVKSPSSNFTTSHNYADLRFGFQGESCYTSIWMGVWFIVIWWSSPTSRAQGMMS